MNRFDVSSNVFIVIRDSKKSPSLAGFIGQLCKIYFFNDFDSGGFPKFRNGLSISIGSGKITVELFSDAISVSVCK